MSTKTSRFKVTQLVYNGKSFDEVCTEYNANRWSYEWLVINRVAVLRVYEIRRSNIEGFAFQDFPAPVNIKYIPKGEAS